jgi:hypothetical protein
MRCGSSGQVVPVAPNAAADRTRQLAQAAGGPPQAQRQLKVGGGH